MLRKSNCFYVQDIKYSIIMFIKKKKIMYTLGILT